MRNVKRNESREKLVCMVVHEHQQRIHHRRRGGSRGTRSRQPHEHVAVHATRHQGPLGSAGFPQDHPRGQPPVHHPRQCRVVLRGVGGGGHGTFPSASGTCPSTPNRKPGPARTAKDGRSGPVEGGGNRVIRLRGRKRPPPAFSSSQPVRGTLGRSPYEAFCGRAATEHPCGSPFPTSGTIGIPTAASERAMGVISGTARRS